MRGRARVYTRTCACEICGIFWLPGYKSCNHWKINGKKRNQEWEYLGYIPGYAQLHNKINGL